MELYCKHLRILLIIQIFFIFLLGSWFCKYFISTDDCSVKSTSKILQEEVSSGPKSESKLPTPDFHSSQYLLELAMYEQDVVISALTALETHHQHLLKPALLHKITEYLDDYVEEVRRIVISSPQKTLVPTILISENPISSFNMMWRFAYNLPVIHELLQSYSSLVVGVGEGIEKEFITDTITLTKWPKSLAVDEAMTGLLRIQLVYDLDPKDLSSGIILRLETGARMNILQTFELGLFARAEKKYTLAIPWLELTINKIQNEPEQKKGFNISLDRLEAILDATMEEHDQDHGRSNQTAKSNSYYYYKDKLLVNGIRSQQKISVRNLNTKEFSGFEPDYDEFYYWNLCSGVNHNFQTEKQKSTLTCWYDRRSSPALYINPIKTELLSNNPRIIQMYDVLGEPTAIKLVNLSRNAQTKPQAKSAENSKIIGIPLVQTSVQALVFDHIPEVSRFIETSSGLSVGPQSSSEHILAETYALGGHFDCRLDAYPRAEANSSGSGYQIATMMFYLMDTIRGGQTVFPNAGISVTPVKGSAVFWYNVKLNGDVDESSYHCACPVALGHKTTATKWIRYKDQFQRVPFPSGLRRGNYLKRVGRS